MDTIRTHLLVLAGGVGGAKLALGLARLLPPQALTIVVNTGDDEVSHGLYILAGVRPPSPALPHRHLPSVGTHKSGVPS